MFSRANIRRNGLLQMSCTPFSSLSAGICKPYTLPGLAYATGRSSGYKLYVHISKKILIDFCGNAIIEVMFIGINCSKTLMTT